MIKFLKVILGLAGILAAAVGALAIVDACFNKHRIKGKYFKCGSDESVDEAAQIASEE